MADGQRRPRPGSRWSLFAVAATLLVAVGFGAGTAPGSSAGFLVPPPAHLTAGEAADDRPAAPPQGIVHAASAFGRPDGSLAAFWYEGASEAGDDVSIRSAAYGPKGWSQPEMLTDAGRIGAEQRRHIYYVGNTAALARPGGEEWLFVASGLGGWSTGQINLLRSAAGSAWGPARLLQATPLLNMGMLVKGAPLALTDGTVALPVYDEISGSSYLLFVNSAGEVVDRARMGRSTEATQPWVVPLGERHAVAFLRDAGRRSRDLWRTETHDGGRTWEPLTGTGIPNPDSPVAVVRLADGRLLLVGNNRLEDPATMEALVSADDGRTWQGTAVLLDGTANARTYRYPWLATDTAGRLHLLVTEYFIAEGRRAIRHLVLGPGVLGEPAH